MNSAAVCEGELISDGDDPTVRDEQVFNVVVETLPAVCEANLAADCFCTVAAVVMHCNAALGAAENKGLVVTLLSGGVSDTVGSHLPKKVDTAEEDDEKGDPALLSLCTGLLVSASGEGGEEGATQGVSAPCAGLLGLTHWGSASRGSNTRRGKGHG